MSDESASRRISIRDLAKILGVSHATVSLALRGSPRISKEVRERICQEAEKRGYRPDPMLAALSQYRRDKLSHPITASIAWINAWLNPSELRGYREFDEYWRGASEAATKFGYRLEEFQLGKHCSPERLHQILTARGIRGILLPPQAPHPDWRGFPWLHYAVVRFGRSLKEPPCHVVTADQVANTVLAIEKIRERGYKRIGFVDNDLLTVKRGHQFQAGFLLSQVDLDESEKIPVLNFSGTTPSDRVKLLDKWLRKNRIDAIFTGFAELPGYLQKLDVRIPEDVAIASTTILDAGITAGIDQHPFEIGRVGFLMLNSLINDGAFGVPSIFRQILVEGSWVDGDSLPNRAG
jgi:DNA-binding LacI/PurR family transcriptional regulator